MLNIAVLVSGGGTNLQALLDAQANGALRSGRITLVVSSKAGAYALTRAQQAGVRAATLTREAGEPPEWYGERLVRLLQQNRIEGRTNGRFVVMRTVVLNIPILVVRLKNGPGRCGETVARIRKRAYLV